MMFNAQTADKQWFGNGGDGWLRIMEFMPDGKTIKIKHSLLSLHFLLLLVINRGEQILMISSTLR